MPIVWPGPELDRSLVGWPTVAVPLLVDEPLLAVLPADELVPLDGVAVLPLAEPLPVPLDCELVPELVCELPELLLPEDGELPPLLEPDFSCCELPVDLDVEVSVVCVWCHTQRTNSTISTTTIMIASTRVSQVASGCVAARSS